MRIIVEMEIETEDYGGREFQKEIENFLLDIDPKSVLKAFKMCLKGDPCPQFDYRSVDWRE